ncbi:MAG: DUF4296 domain-containing protein [Bacteroidales bacterium]|nr:DUF4296 domain-containing protein [Bacteroidales bacterium]
MKYKRVVYILMLMVASILIASCQNRPREVLNRKKMERLMYDVYVAEALMENDYQNFNSPDKKEAYIHQVFRAHDVTSAQWDTSLSWYSDRIDIYLRMNDSVKARLKRDREEIDARLAQQTPPPVYDPYAYSGSYIPPHYSFAAPGARNGFRFYLDSTYISSELDGPRFYFAFNVIGIPPVFNSHLSTLLTLTYKDTTLYHYYPITENREYRINASKYIEEDTLSSVNGFVFLQKETNVTPDIQLYDIRMEGESTDDENRFETQAGDTIQQIIP